MKEREQEFRRAQREVWKISGQKPPAYPERVLDSAGKKHRWGAGQIVTLLFLAVIFMLVWLMLAWILVDAWEKGLLAG